MKLNSLSLQTNMIFARNESEIIERESYIVVKTLSNPGFHWGNYLIFKKAPVEGDIVNWMNIFERKMSHYKEFKHYVFAWDELSEPRSEEYLTHDFELQKSVSLQTSTLTYPKHYNSKIIVRTLESTEDWDAATELQVAAREERFSGEEYREFKINQSESYKKLIKENRGARFGAFLEGKIVADLGIYFEGDLARYQSAVTDNQYRRQGICATLVYESGMYALKNWQIKTLVMEADPDYHAAKVYESVGFTPKEFSYSLYWYKHKNA
ncbi:MAG: GNAT family N-acetyltransferase [Rhizobacter sp.]|nr:GNAT family N-acetyltransferase [Bacteriovorax sp.]